MSSLMEFITDSITPEMTSGLAARFGIPASTAFSALKTSAATLLSGIAAKAGDQAFLSSLYKRLASSTTTAAATAASGAEASSGKVNAPHFLSELFGSGLPSVEEKLSHAAGIPISASAGIMAAATPLVLSSLSARVHANDLTAASFGTMLTSELPSLGSFLPAGFAIPGLHHASDAAAAAAAASAQWEERKTPAGWLWPVLLGGLLFVAGLVWFFSRTQANVIEPVPAAADTASKATATIADSPGAAISNLGAFFKRKLPGGTELNIPENGIESKLVSFIEDANRPVDKTTWFDFDRLLFATNSAVLDPSSTEQLTNIANILKAYPKVDIRIGGYTDNTGDAAANMKLSLDRAVNVMTSLVNLGIDPSRMDAKGYGDEHPVADNATEEGRAKNRRIALRVTDK